MNQGNVFVLVEHERDELRDVSLELLGDARSLANQLSGQVWALVLGTSFPTLPDWINSTLPAYGADRVLLVEHEQLEPYVTEAHLQTLVNICSRFSPTILMLAASRNGQDLAPRLAASLRVPFASDCISFRLTPQGSLSAVRSVYADKAHTTVVLQGEPPFVVTLRPGVAGVGRGATGRKVVVERIVPEINPDLLPFKVVDYIPADPATIDLTEAEVVVVGGRGAGGLEGWGRIQELTEALDASLGATRVAVDLNWAPYERQIGQTGKTVKAKLYVACGVSGASQHVLGMQNSELIVAINTDKTASIFKLAHMGVVGDLNQVIPALIYQIKELRSHGKVKV